MLITRMTPELPSDSPAVHVTGTVQKDVPLPVVPLYDLTFAAQLIPCTADGLRSHLSKHKAHYPARYRREATGARVRLLTAKEIARVRSTMLKGNLDGTLDLYPHD